MVSRRKLLKALGVSATVGIAGCGAPDGGDFRAQPERMFVQLEGGLFENAGPERVGEGDRLQIARYVGATDPLQPVQESDEFDPDGYGPYKGFFVYANSSTEALRTAFENQGYEPENVWWQGQSVNWEQVNNTIELRADLARSFTDEIDIPDLRIEGDWWSVSGNHEEPFMGEVVSVVNKMKGMVLFDGSRYEFVDPDQYVEETNVQVYPSGDGYNSEVTVTYDRDMIESWGDVSTTNVNTGAGWTLGLMEEDGEIRSTKYMQGWGDAFGIATSFTGEMEVPIFYA